MPAGVVAYRRPLVLRELLEVREHLLDGRVGRVGALERLVRVVDVGLVVLVVVDLHRLRVDVRLERVERVREVGNAVRHLPAPLLAGPI